MNKKKMTRRQLAGLILTASATVAAQTTGSTPSSPVEELEAARAHIRHTSDALAKVPVAIDLEPAFHFNA